MNNLKMAFDNVYGKYKKAKVEDDKKEYKRVLDGLKEIRDNLKKGKCNLKMDYCQIMDCFDCPFYHKSMGSTCRAKEVYSKDFDELLKAEVKF